MLGLYLPQDILISYPKHILFQIENIIRELDISTIDFSEFAIGFFQENYLEKNLDLLMVLYEYILQKIPIELDEIFENDVFIDYETSYDNLFLDDVIVKNSNKKTSYYMKADILSKITHLIEKVPEKTKLMNWFETEIKRGSKIAN